MDEITLDDGVAPAASPNKALAALKARRVYKVEQFIDLAQMRIDLSYSASDLTGAMMQQAAMFAHYGILASQASKQVDTIKMLLETTEAAVSRQLRDKAALQGEKTTEPGLAAAVSREDRVLAFKRALTEAKQIEASGKIATEAFRHKRDMLVQHGLIAREEMKGELSIAARNANDEANRSKNDSFLARRAAAAKGSSSDTDID